MPLLFETYKEIKSVPPLEAFPFKAITILPPNKKPPKITFKILSSNNGICGTSGKNKDVKITCNNEKNTKRGDIFLAQNNATGIFKHNKPIEVGRLPPNSSATISAIMAIPIKPPDKIPAGRTRFLVANAMTIDDNKTAPKLIKYFLFFKSILQIPFFLLRL